MAGVVDKVSRLARAYSVELVKWYKSERSGDLILLFLPFTPPVSLHR